MEGTAPAALHLDPEAIRIGAHSVPSKRNQHTTAQSITVDSSCACILPLRTGAMRRGMQDAAASCMQNPAHASRRSSVNRTVLHQIRPSLFASREQNQAPERFSPAPSKHDIDSDRACVLPLRTLVACRANCSAISGSRFTELLALRSFSGTHHAELRTVDVNYRGDVRGQAAQSPVIN